MSFLTEAIAPGDGAEAGGGEGEFAHVAALLADGGKADRLNVAILEF